MADFSSTPRKSTDPLWRAQMRPASDQERHSTLEGPSRHRLQAPARAANTVQRPRSPRPQQPRPRQPRPERPLRQLQPSGPVLRTRESWQNWDEVAIRVGQLPPTVTTWELWQKFQAYGNVIFIEIFENRQGVREDGAKIKFSPAPATAFWQTGVSLVKPNGEGFLVRCSLDQMKRVFRVQSPIHKTKSYPEQLNFSPVNLGFGVMFGEKAMMMKREVTAVPPINKTVTPGIGFRVDLLRKRLVVSFQLQLKDSQSTDGGELSRLTNYMFQVPFAQLEKIYRVNIDKDKWALVLSLDSAPLFYRKRQDVERCHQEKALIWSEFDMWYRQTNITYDPRELGRMVISLEQPNNILNIGRWITYRFVFDNNEVLPTDYNQMKEALSDFNIEIIDLDDFTIIPTAQPQVWPALDSPKINEETGLQSLMNTDALRTDLPFEVRYQLEVCISQNILPEHNITPEFIHKLAEMSAEDPERTCDILEYFSEEEKVIYDPMDIFENRNTVAYSAKTSIPPYCAHTRKVTVTPTTIYISSPTVETSNRVIRRFSEYGDRFLRVQFTDEMTEGRINSCADKVRNDEIFTRVYRTLMNGIRIGDRVYEFLAFGNSQFRENGAYFFCPSEHLSCDDIRRWMGSFDHITVVAKYAARLGLCFSTTRAIRSGGVKIVEIDDVERNGYNFTDGVGKISRLLLEMIATELGLSSAPSVVQFRMGGCKGILVASPDAKGQEVHIRKSQKKFTAEYMGLEIIRCSQYSSATLNRQTITILSSLGVPDEVFNDMLIEQLSNYKKAMTEPREALDLLGRYIDDNHMTMIISTMILNGFMAQKEPFLMSILHLWRSWSIKLLKEKAKIIVERGAFVLGCTDETATLKGHLNSNRKFAAPTEDELPEIFLQLSDKAKPGHYKIIKGICVIGRNPSLHPGDIRVVKAVDVPGLHHLHDVVIFPQLGDRDIPSMCSGGDLDGDDFFVIWDPKLIPKEWNAEPMDYAVPKAKELHRPVMIKDLTKFFVKYMKNDSLPTIAHAHLAQADLLDRSVKDPKCLELANLHSKAVDYVKTGEPAEMPKYLRPRRWPHFMEKKYKAKEQIYNSTKILGQLYDQVESVDFVPHYESPFDKRILGAYEKDNALLKTARIIKTKYDTAMRRVMAQHEIATEFEIWTTFVLSKPRVGSDYKLQEDMAIVSSALKDRFRKVCITEAGGKEFEKLGPFVAAMYRVTWEELAIALHECRTTKTVSGREVPRRKMEPKYMPLISFPWLFHSVLGRIATGVEQASELVDIGLAMLNTRAGKPRPKIPVLDEDDHEDFVETAEGITHRGELLDLFRPDDVDSDGDLLDRGDEKIYTLEDSVTNLDELLADSSDADSEEVHGDSTRPARVAKTEEFEKTPELDDFVNTAEEISEPTLNDVCEDAAIKVEEDIKDIKQEACEDDSLALSDIPVKSEESVDVKEPAHIIINELHEAAPQGLDDAQPAVITCLSRPVSTHFDSNASEDSSLEDFFTSRASNEELSRENRRSSIYDLAEMVEPQEQSAKNETSNSASSKVPGLQNDRIKSPTAGNTEKARQAMQTNLDSGSPTPEIFTPVSVSADDEDSNHEVEEEGNSQSTIHAQSAISPMVPPFFAPATPPRNIPRGFPDPIHSQSAVNPMALPFSATTPSRNIRRGFSDFGTPSPEKKLNGDEIELDGDSDDDLEEVLLEDIDETPAERLERVARVGAE